MQTNQRSGQFPVRGECDTAAHPQSALATCAGRTANPSMYQYEIRACNGSNCSAWSTDVVTTEVTRGAGRPESTTTTTFIHTDGLRSPVVETTASGTVKTRVHYEPYGATTSPPTQGPGYAGHVTDEKTGLNYMQQRYYDPIAGRFLSVDPAAADAGSFNRYWYANNNPYKYMDPDGRYSCTGSHLNCDNFGKAAGLLRNAAGNSRLTKEEGRNLKQVSDFIGTDGDNNNVIIKFEDSALNGGRATYDEKNETTTLTLRPDSDIKNLGKNLAHEGKHGLTDSNRRRTDNNRNERTNNEIEAYTTQGYYQKSIEYSTKSSDPWVYRIGISEENIINSATQSVNDARRGSSTGSCGR